ncbi:hypothetical protein B0O80DRAFT_497278 [Mortierella sp. GBAus27b]|nr:hypothetical protein B0O80DRAFT_497278 [Mortierella sp. GBAus27b]
MTPAPSSSLAFWSILLPLATLIAPMSAAAPGPAPPPVGTFAHTAVIVNNTVFIQGGSMANNLASTASYAIILDSNKSLKNATWLDTSKLSAFTPRSYAAAAPTDNGILICGGTTDNGAMSVEMECDLFNAMWYNKTTIQPPTGTLNRAGMGVAYQKTSDGTKIFFIGGSLNPAKQIASTNVNIATIPSSSSTVMWTAGSDLPVRGIAFHTTTWMGSPTNSIVLFGGDMILYPSVALYNPADGSWTPRNLTMTISDLVRRGHSAVDGGNGKIYIYGGLDLQLKVRNDMMVIDTTQPQPWPLRMLAKGPEGRAFHTATRLPDNTILILWGSTSAGTDAKSTYMVYDIGQDVWTTKTPQLFPPMKEILESPNTPAINNPGSTPVRSGPSTPGLPLIVGISVGCAVLLILIAVLVCRKRRNRAPASDSLSESEEGKPKLAKTHTTQP